MTSPPRPRSRGGFARGALLLPLLLALLVPPAAAADEDATGADVRRIVVRVTAVSGGGIYLDQGRDAGIEPGDQVLLRPLGGATLQAVVRAVSRTSCRAETTDGADGLQVGDEGEVLIPVERLEPADGDDTAQDGQDGGDDPDAPPEHPPWSAPPEAWDEGLPLLAPAFGRAPDERPMEIHGRVFTLLQTSWDRSFLDQQFTLNRLGADVTLENPFGEGGRLHLDGELDQRSVQLEDADDSSSTRGRIDRASYAWGGTEVEPLRVEVGRFLHSEFPEFGVLDGVEIVQRTTSGSRVGASFGYLPEPFPTWKTGQDLETAFFWRNAATEPEDVRVGVGTQATWHQGTRDRNLVVADVDWAPHEKLDLAGSAWVDWYDGSEQAKQPGFELTELRLDGTWRFASGDGLGAHLTRIRWPELLRDEFTPVTLEQLADNRVTRLGLHGWHGFTDEVRLDGRLDRWTDQDDDGGSGDVRLTVRDLLFERGDVSLGAFFTRGAFTEGDGVRVSAARNLDLGRVALSYEIARYDRTELDGTGTNLLQQALRANLDATLDQDWTLSLWGERRFGDDQDSILAGMLLQRRF